MKDHNNNKFISRSFNKVVIGANQTIEKISSDKQKLNDEYFWFTNLPSNFSNIIPKVYGFSENEEEATLEMEYIRGNNLGTLFANKLIPIQNWNNEIDGLVEILKNFYKEKIALENKEKIFNFIYLKKTHSRLDLLDNFPRIKEIRQFPEIIINGKKLKNLEFLLEKYLMLIEEQLIKKNDFPISIVHGDFFFGNIIKVSDGDGFKLVDPRGRFDEEKSIYGDIRYDLAKLMHSISGKYDFIIEDNYKLSQKVDTFNLIFPTSIEHEKLEEYFVSLIEKEFNINPNIIYLIESLLFLTMIPLHKEDTNRQIAFELFFCNLL